MNALQDLLLDVKSWEAERSRLSDLECTDRPADPDEWASSDDHAVSLLRSLVDLVYPEVLPAHDGTGPEPLFTLKGNYGTFELVAENVPAADEAEAYRLTGLSSTLKLFGWRVKGLTGEEWTITRQFG